MEERLGEMRKGRRERMRKGAIVSSSPQGSYDKLELKHQNLVFFKLIECMKQNAKICAIGEQNVIN